MPDTIKSLEIHTLGGLDIRRNGKRLAGLGSRKAEALVVYIGLRAQPVRRETLATLLWPNLSERRALANLSVALASARKALDELLLADPSAIRLEPNGPVEIDARNLQLALAAAQEQSEREGMLSKAQRAGLENALDTYRGDFLAGFSVRQAPTFDEWALLQREHFRALALQAAAMLAKAELNDGQHAAAARWADRGVKLDPLDEELYRLAMRAHALGGEWARAQAAYKRCQAHLLQELETTPSYQTRELAAQIRAAASSNRTNLPVKESIFGRRETLELIKRRLADPACRVLTVAGAPGIGKSHVVRAAAREALGEFLNGSFLILAEQPMTEDHLAASIARELGLELLGDASSADQLADALRRQEMLLVLDDGENLAEALGLIRQLTQDAPSLKFLVASQQRMNLPDAWRIELNGLAIPPSAAAAHPESYAAIQMYTAAAQRAHPGFQLTPDNLDSVVQVCTLVEGSPLAIELATALERSLGSHAIANSLFESLELDAGSNRTRQRSLRSAFDYSFSRLTESMRRDLAAVSVFRGQFTHEQAQAVAGVGSSAVTDLLDRSMLTAADTGRVRLHSTLRQFAWEQLLEDEHKGHQLRDSHARYFTRLLQKAEADLHSPEEARTLSRVDRILDDVKAAWDWSLIREKWALISSMAPVLFRYCYVRGLYREGVNLFTQAHTALEAQSHAEPKLAGSLLLWSASLLIRQGRFEGAHSASQQAHQLFESLAHEEGLAWCELTQARCLPPAADPDQAAVLALQSLVRSQALSDPIGSAHALNILGRLAYAKADLSAARERFEESARIWRTLGDRQSEAMIRINLSNIHYRLGQYLQAREQLELALPALQAVGHKSGLARVLNNLGNVAHQLAELDRAEDLFQQSLELKQRLGERLGIANSLGNLGIVAEARGSLHVARQLRHDALRLHRQIGNHWGAANEINGLGSIAAKLGEAQTAKRHFLTALQIGEQTDALVLMAEALLGLAELHASAGETAAAYRLVSLVRRNGTGDDELSRRADSLLADLRSEIEDVERSALDRETSDGELRVVIKDILARAAQVDSGAPQPEPQQPHGSH